MMLEPTTVHRDRHVQYCVEQARRIGRRCIRILDQRGGTLLIVLSLAPIAACSSISPSTVRLSSEVQDRQAELAGLHQLAIRRSFDLEREKIERFLEETWEPLFLKNFLGTSGILEDLQAPSSFEQADRDQLRDVIETYLSDSSEADAATNRVLELVDESRTSEPGTVRTALSTFVEDQRLEAAVNHVMAVLRTEDPARMIMEFAEAAHAEMLLQRRTMLEPLEQAESQALALLAESYAQLQGAQGAITGRLEAASKVSQQQDKLFDQLAGGGASERLREGLARLSATVGGAIDEAARMAGAEGNRDPEVIANGLSARLKDLF